MDCRAPEVRRYGPANPCSLFGWRPGIRSAVFGRTGGTSASCDVRGRAESRRSPEWWILIGPQLSEVGVLASLDLTENSSDLWDAIGSRDISKYLPRESLG